MPYQEGSNLHLPRSFPPLSILRLILAETALEAHFYPPADEFVFDATAEDLTLYCASKANIPSRFLPLFALFSVDKGLWLSPDFQLGKLAFQTVSIEQREERKFENVRFCAFCPRWMQHWPWGIVAYV